MKKRSIPKISEVWEEDVTTVEIVKPTKPTQPKRVLTELNRDVFKQAWIRPSVKGKGFSLCEKKKKDFGFFIIN